MTETQMSILASFATDLSHTLLLGYFLKLLFAWLATKGPMVVVQRADAEAPQP